MIHKRIEAVPAEVNECGVCGKTGKAADKCEFQRCCSCWYGVPCANGESMRQRNKADKLNATPAV